MPARFTVVAAALTAHDPAFDPDGRGAAAAHAVITRIAGVALAGPA